MRIYIYNNWGSTNRPILTRVATSIFWKKKFEKEIYPNRKIDPNFTNYHMTPRPTRACHVPILKTHFFFLSLIPISHSSETLISLKAILSETLISHSFSPFLFTDIHQFSNCPHALLKGIFNLHQRISLFRDGWTLLFSAFSPQLSPIWPLHTQWSLPYQQLRYLLLGLFLMARFLNVKIALWGYISSHKLENLHFSFRLPFFWIKG